jgi:hypothetical protein
MDVRSVDLRDVGWEIVSPLYRVYFWARPPAPSDVPEDLVMYHSTEFELSGVEEVGEVLSWAEAAAASGSTYTVYVVVEGDRERGLVRLAGLDPTASAGS